MGIDINGLTISSVSSGIQINPGVTFNSSGFAYNAALPGYSGWKDISGNDIQYSAVSGWEINATAWSGGGLNTSTGVFTCPVAGYYAVGFNGIANGGSVGWDDGATYGYAGFAKNGALSYYIHWNLSSTNGWNQCGGSSLFQCAANDTLALFINRSPSPAASTQTYNRGWYPHNHHAIWCVLVG
jgi:hypothetical protein